MIVGSICNFKTRGERRATKGDKRGLIDCFTAHQHRKAISAKKRC